MLPAFGSPWFLLLGLLVPWAVWLARRSDTGLSRVRRAFSIGLRVLVLLLLILALSGLRILKRNERLAVFFLIDRSESIPAEKREEAHRYVLEAANGRDLEQGDLVGAVAFGKVAGIERIPTEDPLDLESFETLIEPDATNLAAAVRLAAAAFPEGVGKRIVILSDGNENRESVLDEARVARSLGIAVDTVPIVYSHAAEISLEKLLVDPEVNIGQPFDIRVVVEATKETEANLRLFENDVPVPQTDSRTKLHPGKNVIDFKGRRIEAPGRYYYEARLEAVRPEDDGILQNNVAFGFTFVEGEPKVLLCASEPELDGALVKALRSEKIGVSVIAPEYLPDNVEEYLEYECIILSNVAAHQLSEEKMKMFESLVKTVGVGFIMIGGENSYGAGGYQGTPVERLLPVEMEIKQRKVLPNGALAFVVHSCELGNGNWWARDVIQKALRILSPRDYAGVLYFGMGGETWLFPMTAISARQMMLSRLKGFEPGDMPQFEPIMRMALQGLQKTQASIKHMVVLSDGDPTEPSAQLVNAIRKERITISTICYGAHGGIPPLMQDLARKGGGKFYHLKKPSDLPEMILREAANVQRSLISEERFLPLLNPAGLQGSSIVQGIGPGDLPALDGYVITSPKDLASLLLLHPPGKEDPVQDPVLAAWAYGLGKSVAFTSDAGRRWGKDWVAWSGYQRFWVQCVRWVARTRNTDRFRLTRTVEGDKGSVAVDALTPDGQFVNSLRFSGNVVTPDFETRPVAVRQVGPGRYQTDFPVGKKGTYTVVLNYEKDGRPATYVTGVSVPYSPEYRRLETDAELLRQVAEAGGGRYHANPADALEGGAFFSRDFPASHEVQEIWRELLTLATILFFIDVFVRRVVVNYVEALVAGADWCLRWVSRRKAVVEPADERLSTLLGRKAQLRDASLSRYVPRQDTWAKAEPPPLPTAMAPPALPETAAAVPPVSPEPEQPPPQEPASFTARLLEAKRRALKKEGKK